MFGSSWLFRGEHNRRDRQARRARQRLAPRRRSSRRASLEPLEDRTLLSAVPVAGDLDTTFGAGGLARADFGAGDQMYDMAVVPSTAATRQGYIVAVGQKNLGYSTGDFTIASFKPDGSPDTGFGSGGKVTLDFGGNDWASAVAIQSDGKIIVAGRSRKSVPGKPWDVDFVMARYLTNGTLDKTFGKAGKVTLNIGLNDGARDIAIDPATGKIYAALDWLPEGTSYGPGLARFNANGTLDTTFAGKGWKLADLASVSTIVVQGGKLYLAGSAYAARDQANRGIGDVFAVARYDLGGTLDNTFDADGIVTKFFGDEATDTAWAYSGANAIAFQPGGKIVVGGGACVNAGHSNYGATTGSDQFLALVRFDASGVLDTSFGVDGAATTNLGASSNAPGIGALAIQPDGKIVASSGGLRGDPAGGSLLLRYSPDGTLDQDFGSSYLVADSPAVFEGNTGTSPYTTATVTVSRLMGVVRTQLGVAALQIQSQLDGSARIIAGGSVESDFAVARFLTTGLANPDAGASVTYATADGIATVADGDYVAQTGTLTFATGQREQTITVQIVGDTRFDGVRDASGNLISGPDENLRIVLSNSSGAAIVGSGTSYVHVFDDDPEILAAAAGLAAKSVKVQSARTTKAKAAGAVRAAAASYAAALPHANAADQVFADLGLPRKNKSSNIAADLAAIDC